MASRVARLALLMLLFFSSCDDSEKNNSKIENGTTTSISKVMIGKWQSSKQIEDETHGSYLEEYQVEIFDENSLRLTLSSPHDGFSAEFTYMIIDENTLLVENERAKGGHWKVNKEGKNF